MNFNDEVDWPDVFGGYIARSTLADPKNKRRTAYLVTMLFVEAGFREIEDQLSGRSTLGRDDLGLRITRKIVVARANRIMLDELPEHGLSVGEGGFKDRWPGDGGMFNFFMCLVRYSFFDPRWRFSLDYGPRKVFAELARVKSGELRLADLITRVARHDLRLRVRLEKCWLFRLSLTVDAKWKAVATRSYRRFLEEYAERWIPVYDEAIRQLGVRLRPGMSTKKLCAMVCAQIAGFAEHIAGTGDESYLYGEDSVALFAEAVQLLIEAAIDPRDRHIMTAGLGMS